MVQADGSNDANFGLADVRGIQSAAQTGLQNHHVDVLLPEFQKCNCGDQLEERRRHGLVLLDNRFIMRPQLLGQFTDAFMGRRATIDLDTFADLHQVRARIKSRPASLCPLNRFNHRARRAFAVRAGDMKNGGA